MTMSKRFHLRHSSSSGSDPPSPNQVTPPRPTQYHEIKIDDNSFGAWCMLHSNLPTHFFWSQPGDVFTVLNPDDQDPRHYIVKVKITADHRTDNWADKIHRMNEFVSATPKEAIELGGSPEETIENLEMKMMMDHPSNFLDQFDRWFLLKYYKSTYDFGYHDVENLDEARIEDPSEPDSGAGQDGEPVSKRQRKE